MGVLAIVDDGRARKHPRDDQVARLQNGPGVEGEGQAEEHTAYRDQPGGRQQLNLQGQLKGAGHLKQINGASIEGGNFADKSITQLIDNVTVPAGLDKRNTTALGQLGAVRIKTRIETRIKTRIETRSRWRIHLLFASFVQVKQQGKRGRRPATPKRDSDRYSLILITRLSLSALESHQICLSF